MAAIYNPDAFKYPIKALSFYVGAAEFVANKHTAPIKLALKIISAIGKNLSGQQTSIRINIKPLKKCMDGFSINDPTESKIENAKRQFIQLNPHEKRVLEDLLSIPLMDLVQLFLSPNSTKNDYQKIQFLKQNQNAIFKIS